MRGFVVSIVAGVFAMLAVVVVAAVPHSVSSRMAASMLTQKLSAWSGAAVTIHGEPRATMLPWPEITVTDVEISPDVDGQQSQLRIPSLTASLKLLPLFSGRLEVGALTLTGPEILLARGDADSSCVPGWVRHVFASLLTEGSGTALTQVVLSDGAIRLADCPFGHQEALQSVDLNLSWDRVAGIAAAFGSFEWRGQTVDVDVAFDEPGEDGIPPLDRGHLTLSMRPSPPHLQDRGTQGQVISDPEAVADNDALPQRLVEDITAPVIDRTPFNALEIRGQFDLDEDGLRLSRVKLDLNGSKAEGALAFELDGREALLRGSLSIGDLDVVPYLWALAAARSGQIEDIPVSADLLPRIGIDLRAAIDEVSIGGVDLLDANMSLLVRAGHAVFALNEAEIAGGTVAGKVTAAPAGSGLRVRLSGRLDAVSMEEFNPSFWSRGRSALIGSTQPPEGIVTAQLDLAGEGDTVSAIVGSLEGAFAADIRNGSIGGADIVSTLERVAQGTLLIADGKPFIPMAGRTHFDRTAASADVRAGVVRVRDVQIIGERFEISLSGKGGLSRGELEAEGVASLFSDESDDDRLRPKVELPFGVGGTVFAPMIAPGIPRFGEAGGGTAAREARPGSARPVIENCRPRHIDGEPVCSETAPSPEEGTSAAAAPSNADIVPHADLTP